MKPIIISAAAILLAALPTAATAQQADTNPFVGPYVGAQVGWGERSNTFDLGIARAKVVETKRAGIEGGIYAGYLGALGSAMVAGFEASAGFGGKTLSADLASDVKSTINPDYNISWTGRLGFLPSNRVMVYGLAGYGAERIDVMVKDGATTTNKRQWADGPVYGAGVEVAVTPSMSARVQYKRLDIDGAYSPDQVLFGTSLRF